MFNQFSFAEEGGTILLMLIPPNVPFVNFLVEMQLRCYHRCARSSQDVLVVVPAVSGGVSLPASAVPLPPPTPCLVISLRHPTKIYIPVLCVAVVSGALTVIILHPVELSP